MTITKLKLRFYGDPALRKETECVKYVGASERMLIAAMISTMHYEKGIGLAAPQVGINQQIFVVDVGEGPMVFINPEIVKKSGSGELEEGCLSIPGVNIVVTRHENVIVRYTDENNKIQEKVFEELLARVVQHETDHLQGKLIVDYATEEELTKFKEQLEGLEEQNKN